MEEKLNLSVILPIKSAVVKDFDEFFDKAIKSLKLQKIAFNELLIVHTSEEQLVNKLQSYDFESLKMLVVSGFHFLNLMTNILVFGLIM